MGAFPDEAWVSELDERLCAAPTDHRGPDLVVQYDIGEPGDDPFRYHLVVTTSGSRAAVGAHASPSAVFRLDAGTAAAINRGDLSAAEAFVSGRLDLDGDVSVLLAAHDAPDGQRSPKVQRHDDA